MIHKNLQERLLVPLKAKLQQCSRYTNLVYLLKMPHLCSGKDSGCLRIEGDKISIIDPGAKDVDVLAKATRTYRVTRALPAHASQEDVFTNVGQPALHWLWEGFNVSGAGHIVKSSRSALEISPQFSLRQTTLRTNIACKYTCTYLHTHLL
jgi:hypothetical protein